MYRPLHFKRGDWSVRVAVRQIEFHRALLYLDVKNQTTRGDFCVARVVNAPYGGNQVPCVFAAQEVPEHPPFVVRHHAQVQLLYWRKRKSRA